MSEPTVLFILGLSALAFWQRSITLYLLAMISSFFLAAIWGDSGIKYAVIGLLLGFALTFKFVVDLWRGRLGA